MQYTFFLPVLAGLAAAFPASCPSSGQTGTSGSSNNVTSGQTLKATFTQYGAGDNNGSPTCNTNTVACGFYTPNAYYAALSQNYYGAGPGQGAGPACGTCWRLTPQTDSSGNTLTGANSIVVKVNNLCPAQGNPLCAQDGPQGTNQYGGVANFDTCMNDGASQALFGSSGVGLAVGEAQEVDCGEWSSSNSKRFI